MALDPQARAVLDQMAETGGPPINDLSVHEARQASAALAAMQGLPEPVGIVEDRTLLGPGGGIPVRIYVPFGKGPFPVLVYFHGGGWVIGDLESSDGLCRILTNAAGCIVVSVDYRLAPEHPFPAAADDAYHATLWAATSASSFGGDPSRIGVSGDSAGGNLAINKLTPFIFPPAYMDHGINIEYAAQFKKALHVPVSVVGAVTLEQAEEAIASGKVDMVALCRQLIADPETVNKIEWGLENEVRPCVRCNTCISRSHFGSKPPRCAVNPLAGRELDYDCIPAPKRKKKVVVVGGGPAGLEAARTLAERGHEVVLFEKSPQLGGLLWGAVKSPVKSDLKKYLDWSIRMTTRHKNINLRIATEATLKLIAEEKADALILALGGSPVIPKLTCQDESKVIWVGDVDKGNVQVGNNVLIAGAGLTGCEAALRFLQSGKKVTLIDALPREQLGSGSSPINAYALFNILAESNVDLRTQTKLVDVTQEYALVVKDGREEGLVFDTVVLSLGTKVDTEAINQLRTSVAECYVVGNSNGKSGTVWNATTSAFDAAMAV